MRRQPHEEWPDQLLLIGDQVYADEDAPRTREYIRARRDTSGVASVAPDQARIDVQ